MNQAVTDTAALREKLAGSPGGVLEAVAQQHGVSLRTVVEALPEEMWVTVPGTRFVEVMQDVAHWGDVLTIVHTQDVVMEFKGPVPMGKLGRGFYNLHGETGLAGHLKADNCDAIAFVRRPFMAKDTASIQFFNAGGEAMFKVFVGRDDEGELRGDQLDMFEALRARLTGAADA